MSNDTIVTKPTYFMQWYGLDRVGIACRCSKELWDDVWKDIDNIESAEIIHSEFPWHIVKMDEQYCTIFKQKWQEYFYPETANSIITSEQRKNI